MLFLAVIFCILCLLASGEVFIRGSIQICERFKIPPFIMGATVIAFGTALPDLFVASLSSIRGHYDISVGSVMGSNIVNILVGIGLVAIVGGVKYEKSDLMLKFGMYYSIFLVFIFITLLAIFGGKIGFITSIILLSASVFFAFINIKYSLSTLEEAIVRGKKKHGVITLIMFIGGLAALLLFSELLIHYVMQLSEQYQISKKVVATSIVGLGNSLPEIITVLMATIKKRPGIAMGDIIGSNIYILGGVLGVSGLFSNVAGGPIEVVLPILFFDVPMLLFVSGLFFILYKIKNHFGKITGLIFIFLYLLYILLQISII